MTQAHASNDLDARDAPDPEALTTEPAIRVENLSQRYGRLEVLHDVSFEVNHGEIFGFIGPNGAGKTTTIRTMATLLEPSAGHVEICGVDVALDPEGVRRSIGYMPDHSGVYERITVREYLEFFAHAHGIHEPEATEAVIELTELQELSQRLVASLSKGNRQRLQLARVLLHDPRVLILDEPASDLDPRARIEIRDLLLELRELGKTIFLSSHILSELSDVCSSVGIIERGRLLVAGPIDTIAARLAEQQHGSGQAAAAVATTQQASPPAATADQPTPAAPPVELTPGGAVVPNAVQHRLRLRVLGDTFRLKPLLDACPPITRIDVANAGLVTISYVGNPQFVAELVRYLVSHGIDLVAVEPERSELERIFLEVTQGRLQ